jgi:SAM-dependent methyltransferase
VILNFFALDTLGNRQMAKIERLPGSWYDYPRYYDIAMKEETPFERKFLEEVCRACFPGRSAGALRLYEPGLGTGRLLAEMAGRGYRVAGCDLSPMMIAYAQRRLRRRKLAAELTLADMATHRSPARADLAYCLVSTVRHLSHEQCASHLDAVADSLAGGGIYVLGLIVVPTDTTAEEGFERWSVDHRGSRVTVTLSVTELDMRRRQETMRTMMTIKERGRTRRIVSESTMYLYTPGDLRRLMKRSGRFEVLATYDFNYMLSHPQPFDDRFGDVVLLLQKIG